MLGCFATEPNALHDSDGAVRRIGAELVGHRVCETVGRLLSKACSDQSREVGAPKAALAVHIGLALLEVPLGAAAPAQREE